MPPEILVRFLSETGSFSDDFYIMRSLPTLPFAQSMVRALDGLVRRRARCTPEAHPVIRDKLFHIGQRPPPKPSMSERPDWMQANPARIERALSRALARPTGGWYVLGASRHIDRHTPSRFVVEGEELVAFRDDVGVLCVAPAALPSHGRRSLRRAR